MVNKNYAKGRKKEYKFINMAKERGFIAFRSAGSHSPIDVCIIDRIGRNVGFLQCKPDSMSDNAKQKLLDEMCELSGAYNVRFDVV